MKGISKKNNLGKNQLRKVYCSWCRNKKSCGLLDEEKKYCCSCYSWEILTELEQEGLLIDSAQETLDNYRLGVMICHCSETKKPRLEYISSDGSGWTKCEGCDKTIASAGHQGVIKNRNDSKFWGLRVKEKVLCGECLKELVIKMPKKKQYLFNEYRKRYNF